MVSAAERVLLKAAADGQPWFGPAGNPSPTEITQVWELALAFLNKTTGCPPAWTQKPIPLTVILVVRQLTVDASRNIVNPASRDGPPCRLAPSSTWTFG